MPIKKPAKRLGRSVKLKFVTDMIMGHGKLSPIHDLNVTPMVDMLVMLVIFLLMTFSATGEILFISKDIVLPGAFNATPMERAPVIAISNAAIAFEGEMVVNTATVNEKTFPGGKIPALKDLLDRSRQSWTDSHPSGEFDGQVIIQCHNEVPFLVLKMIMKTCAEAQYMGMNFAIQEVSRAAATPPAHAG